MYHEYISPANPANNIPDAYLSDGVINATDLPVRIDDDTKLRFADDSEYTGKQLAVMLRLLKKFTMEQFPEEFV